MDSYTSNHDHKPIEEDNQKQCNFKIDDYDTSFYSSRLPSRKMKFKQLIYKRRLNYGSLCSSGLVDDDLRYLNLYIKAEQPDSDNVTKKNSTCLNTEEVLSKLIYSADFNFNLRDSRREAKLKHLLNDKLKQLNELKRLKKMKQS